MGKKLLSEAGIFVYIRAKIENYEKKLLSEAGIFVYIGAKIEIYEKIALETMYLNR